MNASAVTVIGDASGNVITVSKNNPEYGYVKLEQSHISISNTGWLKVSKRSTLIKGRVNDLVSANFIANTTLPGKIIVMESHDPFNKENPSADLKVAGQSGVVCRVGDEPIYRQTFYSADETAQDVLIQHDNSEEIKEAIRSSKEKAIEENTMSSLDGGAINDVF
jgi:hypothetical protein